MLEGLRRADEKFEKHIPTSLPGISVEKALRRLGGNRELFLKILGEFSRDFAGYPQEIRDALERHEMDLAHQQAHTLKGLAGNISAGDLQAAASEVEKAISEEVLENIDTLLGNVEKALNQVLESVRTLHEREENRQKPDIVKAEESFAQSMDKIEPMLNDLAEFLRKRDPVKTEEYMNSVKKYFTASAHYKQIMTLENQINRFDFKAAFKTLMGIAESIKIPLEGDEIW